MDKEIKEILTNCEKAINEASGYNNTTDKILDYITNLQQENKTLHENNQSMQEEMARAWQKCDDYKSRCKKAIEYIENDLQISILPNNQIIHGKEVIKRINKIINILQNGSEEK